jgi:hypothetical protein
MGGRVAIPIGARLIGLPIPFEVEVGVPVNGFGPFCLGIVASRATAACISANVFFILYVVDACYYFYYFDLSS